MTREVQGYSVPQIDGFEIHDVLGQGSTSTAYSVTNTSNHQFVAKVYCRLESAEEDMKHEKEILEILSPVENVPVLEAVCEAKFGKKNIASLILSPVGIHLERPNDSPSRSLTLADLCSIVDTLHNAHLRGVIHRDVRLSNLYLLLDGGVLVNDWGCACRKVRYIIVTLTLVTILLVTLVPHLHLVLLMPHACMVWHCLLLIIHICPVSMHAIY